MLLCVPYLIWTIIRLLDNVLSSWLLSFALAIILTSPLPLSIVFVGQKILALSSLCPITLYSEQLNPERIILHRLWRNPVEAPLNKVVLRWRKSLFGCTSVILTGADDKTIMALACLTTEEKERLVQYYRQANPHVVRSSLQYTFDSD